MTLKVLQLICPTGYYGAERWVNALLNARRQEGIEHHLAITEEPGSSDEVLTRSPLPPCRQHRLAMRSKFDVGVVARLTELIRSEKIDIIHTHGYKSDILGVWAARRAGIHSICTPHGFENADDFKLKTYLWLGGKAFKYFDWVCPLSPDIKRALIETYGVKSEKLYLINNGVDLSEVELAVKQAPAKTESETFTIGYIGQLISRKNLSALLEAFARFYQQQPQARLVLIGDGDERNRLEQLSRQLGINAVTEFLGFRDDRLAYLPQFDTFALTSSLEGIPRCLMEAMAAHICVTAFDIPGVDVLIKHDKTGLLAPFNNTQALADIWTTLANNAERKYELARAGQVCVYSHFSADAMASAYAALYQDVIMNQVGAHA
ncbi:MAG: glycosyltransferase [Saccharospirillum sp.]